MLAVSQWLELIVKTNDIPRVDTTSWVGWGAQDEQARCWFQTSFQGSWRQQKAIVSRAVHNDRRGSCQFCHFWVADPKGCRNQNLHAPTCAADILHAI